VKLLITGGTGFIGRNLAAQYAARHDVAAPSRADLDLLDAEAVRAYLERHRFDAVIHAATERANRLLGSALGLFDRNCRMFFHLARNARAFGRMLFLSSGAVYGMRGRPMLSEDAFDACVPADDYGFSKYVCARAVDGMERVYELRLFGVFGSYEDWRVRFISNACCRALHNLPLVIRQNVFFDYLDVEDLGCILERLAAAPLRHRHYNVCTGRAVDLRTLAEHVLAASCKAPGIEIRNDGLGPEYSGDNSLLLAEFPDIRFRPVDQSIRRLYAWYEARKATIDPALLRFDE